MKLGNDEEDMDTDAGDLSDAPDDDRGDEDVLLLFGRYKEIIA